jgi:hypothetical protein
MNRTSRAGTAISATAWALVCGYLYFAWPSLAALLEALPVETYGVTRVPASAFLAIGVLTVLGLSLKDRWLRAPAALAVDALVAAPALAAIALLLEPFLAPID